MTAIDLIDTTEMYLKTIFEMEEDQVTPLRARIVERLGHSGPTVSQTIARMERDGLVWVRGDRKLELTPDGRQRAVEVMRKHRLAERLLVDLIGMDWTSAHEEACRWEHVMSDTVESKLIALLGNPTSDPYGNPIPGVSVLDSDEQSLEAAVRSDGKFEAVISRIGEPVQAERWLLGELEKAGINNRSKVLLWRDGDIYHVSAENGNGVAITNVLSPHFFVTRCSEL